MNHRMTTLRFPELSLRFDDVHVMRGYFGTAFPEHGPLLHNHLEDGTHRMGYPLIQYKVVDDIPTITGLNEGADVLVRLFADINQIVLNGNVLDASAKQLDHDKITPQLLESDLAEYEFATPYQALNQKHYAEYRNCQNERERFELLRRILTGHLLVVFKELGIRVDRIVAWPHLRPGIGRMKTEKVTVFHGTFVTNADLPDLLGIGKGSSRGFGTIRRLPGRLG